ncbi:hypothetical protein GCM10017783_19460 [Deinococcus piscis]|uniref:Uncharacterized protein n=1 Tax=Deinococcus piscis TaxID=394230 RepID=A0ABQ3K8L7_9DEIO|nr:toxic anion resistance protein [Deinococcus piscis]GHG06994.1 hypothetical protein GCM10017783_19460 [Deinococcus piscis]
MSSGLSPTGLTPEEQAQLRAQAQRLATDLALLPHHSPEFRRQVAAVQALGGRAQAQAARLGRALPTAGSNHAPPLSELRQLMARLQPAQPGLLARLLGRRPTALTSQEYAQVAAQSTPLLEGLYRSQDALRRQQAALSEEQQQLAGSQAELERALALTTEVEHLLSASLPDLEARQPLHAAAVQSEVLYLVRERRTDLNTALATTAQAQLALEVARRQAAELDTQLERSAAGVVLALKLARRAVQAAELRSAAAQASEQLQGAQQRMEGAASLDDLNAALAQAYASLDDLERLEGQARSF